MASGVHGVSYFHVLIVVMLVDAYANVGGLICVSDRWETL